MRSGRATVPAEPLNRIAAGGGMTELLRALGAP
jgi:hypothetical protein